MDCIKGGIECNSRRPVVAGVCCLLVEGGKWVGGRKIGTWQLSIRTSNKTDESIYQLVLLVVICL